ncbi:MFS transporter [Streptomyces albidus (ex Kaewkla and Franco 2022)]|uniref:MFS transporter n=1 Tax=Streptomyces albidus (ex Kaewkla and Franco 2022) TaxID=722709 RepID=UPI002814C13B|nr:MFS transporter [Streptomyces albidus (ex Kaewkla and Franco 2022)]
MTRTTGLPAHEEPAPRREPAPAAREPEPRGSGSPDSEPRESGPRDRPRPRVHRAWWVAAVSFVALVGAAAFRATPGVFIDPLHDEFGWSHSTISAAVSVNVLLYGLTSPFSAALMERYGIRRIVSCALLLIAAGSGLTVFMDATWQLILCWGFLVGLGSGSMALAFAATVTNRWFIQRRGLVTGILTAGSAAGQLIFLPLVALLVEGPGWRTASLAVAVAALAVVPLVLFVLRDRPEDAGLRPYGAGPGYVTPPPAPPGAAKRALRALLDASRSKVFWLLAGTFAVCGASTNGLIGTHFVPAAHDHGMPVPAAASLLAVIGLFDLVGTVASGWFTDRFDARRLLAVYYALRGVSLLFLPLLFAETVQPTMLFFIVFYGLDWVATVPPTIALCREHFGENGAIVFGWVLASHQLGASVVAFLTGVVRDTFGSYDVAWVASGALCATAALMALVIRRRPETEVVVRT